MIVVSACLLGENCRYDGSNTYNKELVELFAGRELLPVCPELSGNLPVPREPAEIVGGDGFDVLNAQARVLCRDGMDVTLHFVNGSKRVMKKCKNHNNGIVKMAVLKARSPSCGVRKIYDGNFNGRLKPGPGVMAARLKKEKIPVYTEDDLEKIKEIMKK
ncbi:MAG: DUF523 domain-containing protein [Halanaerobiaceae bacterium]